MASTGSTSDSEIVVKSRCEEMAVSSISRGRTKRRRRDRQLQSDRDITSRSSEADECSSCGSISSRNSSIPRSSFSSRRDSEDEYGSSYDADNEDRNTFSVPSTPKIKNSRRTERTKRLGLSAWIILSVLLGLCISLHPNFSSLSSIRSTFLLMWDNEYYHVRHPLYFHHRPQSLNRIRYLTLGSSATWGHGLEIYDETEYNKETETPRMRSKKRGHLQAYPYLLSPRVHNAATKTGGPELSALCTESIIGNKHRYDVIVLEFSFDTSNGDGLKLLAQRIRQRFPNATIIFVQLWSPSQFYTVGTATADAVMLSNDDSSKNNKITTSPNARISLDELRSTIAKPESLSLDNDGFVMAIKEHQWEFRPNDQHEADLQTVAAAIQGHIVRLPVDRDASTTLSSAKEIFFELDPSDLDHESSTTIRKPIEYSLTPKGHQLIAEKIRDIVDEQNILKLPKKLRDDVGTWGSGDQCSLWYETGYGMPLKYSKLRLRQFSRAKNKYALEVPTATTSSTFLSSITNNKRERQKLKAAVGGGLTISNPFPDERMVFLSYMTSVSEDSSANSGDDSSKPRVYPRTQVILNGKPTVILDPYHDNNDENQHMTRTTAIGYIPAKTSSNIVEFTSLQSEATESFRIVGVSLFPNERRNHKIATEFALSPEPAHIG